MRQLAAAAAVVAVGVVVVGCGGKEESSPSSSSATATTTATTSSKPPVGLPAMEGLLLSPAEVDALLGVTGASTKQKIDAMQADDTKQYPQGWKWPTECIYINAPAEAAVYADSKFTAVLGHDDVATGVSAPGDVDPELTQSVVSFPSAKEASAFFTTSADRWPACANRQFTIPSDADNPEMVWQVGPVSNANGVVSTTVTVTVTKGANSIKGTCQRALTVRNNVAIDISACGQDPGDKGVKAAEQIAGKVDKL